MDQEFPVNFYDLLQITPKASQAEIKKAFRRLSKMHHPDLSGQEAGDKQQLLNQAMAVLSKPQSRRRHDAYWSHNGKAKADDLPGEFFTLVKIFRDRLQKAIHNREKALRNSITNRIREIEQQLQHDIKKPRLWPSIFLALVTANIILGIFYQPAFLVLIILGPLFYLSLRKGHRGKLAFFQSLDSTQAIKKKAEIIAEARIQREIDTLEIFTEDLDLLLAIFRRTYIKQETRDMMVKISLGFFLQGFEPIKYSKHNNTLYFSNQQSSILVKIQDPLSSQSAEHTVKSINRQMVEEKIINAYIFLLNPPSQSMEEMAKPRGIQLHDQRQSSLWLMEISRDLTPEPPEDFLEKLKDLTHFVKKFYR